MQETRTYLKDTLYRDKKKQSSQSILGMKIRIFRKKKKKKWAIKITKSKQETALNKKTNFPSWGTSSFWTLTVTQGSAESFVSWHLARSCNIAYFLKISVNSLRGGSHGGLCFSSRNQNRYFSSSLSFISIYFCTRHLFQRLFQGRLEMCTALW